MSARPRVPHLPALDGLRGIALLGVLFFHASGLLPGGFLGVDLFFVLSGYLITSILLAEHRDTARIDLKAFWIRRARRLFPALLSLMPAIALYAAFLAKPDEVAGLRKDALATLAYVANWRAIFAHKSYWQLFASPSPLEHTWSLSIEEQFYVAWPLLIGLVLRMRKPRAPLFLSLGVALLGIVATLLLFNLENTSRVYLGTDTRAVGIALGAALATVIAPGRKLSTKWVRATDALGVASALLLAWAWWKMTGDRAFLYHGGLWLTELGALVLIVAATQGPRSMVARALAWSPLRLLGTISYGVYLWHWPVNVALTADRVHAHGWALHAIHFAVTFAIAGLSYRFFERPILKRGLPFGRPIVVVPAAVAIAVVFIVSGTHARAALPSPEAKLVENAPTNGLEPGAPLFRIMVVGDSTANSLGWSLRGVRAPGVSVELHGRDACTLLQDSCGGPTWAAETDEVKPDVTFVMVGGAFMHGIGADGDWRKACYPAWDRTFEGTLKKRLPDLASLRGKVYAVTIPYGLEAWSGDALRGEVDCINRSIREAAASTPGVEILDLAGYLCPSGECQVTSDGATIRPDGVHYAIDGANAMAKWVLGRVVTQAETAASAP